MMDGMVLDDSVSILTSGSNEASISSSGNRNEVAIGGGGGGGGGSSLYPPPPQQPPTKRKRNLPGNPDPDAEIVALSPKTLMATNRFLCEICNKGFQRDQNLQLHRRGHNLPWKLKQRSKLEVVKKKVYVCPEVSCVHHDPSRALGDLTGIKKHFYRKHGEKKWKCEKCSKRYAVQSDWKAHSKICGTREYRCDCGTLFSRRDSFITHRAFCDALAEESGRAAAITNPNPLLSFQQQPTSHFNLPPFHVLKREPDHYQNQNQNHQLHHHQSFNSSRPELPPWLANPMGGGGGGDGGPGGSSHLDLSTQLFPPQNQNPNPSHSHSPGGGGGGGSGGSGSSTGHLNPLSSLPSFHQTPSAHMSATALLQKAAQMGVTMSKNCPITETSSSMRVTHQAHMSTVSGRRTSSPTAGSVVGQQQLGFPSPREERENGFAQTLASFGSTTSTGNGTGGVGGGGETLHDVMMMGSSSSSSLPPPHGSNMGFDSVASSSFEEALHGMLNPKLDCNFQSTFTRAMESQLHHPSAAAGDGMTRDFLGLRPISQRGFPNMAGLDQISMSSSPSPFDQQNQNHHHHHHHQTHDWQG